ncbi:MAG: type II toxin-antitoxin system VapC family toxin [Limisphaerales bacterium]
MSKPSVYLETTIVSYLTARPSRDLITTACQQLTHEWWENRRAHYDLYISDRVIIEASAGNAEMAQLRLEKLKKISVLSVSDEVKELAKLIIKKTGIPPKASEDAIHIALTAVNELDYLLTWNCKHIANAHVIKQIGLLFAAEGLKCPVICTPQELMEN